MVSFFQALYRSRNSLDKSGVSVWTHTDTSFLISHRIFASGRCVHAPSQDAYCTMKLRYFVGDRDWKELSKDRFLQSGFWWLLFYGKEQKMSYYDYYNIMRAFFWVVVIFVLVMWICISYKFIDVVVEKGYEHSSKWFWVVFFCGIFGIMYIIALPDRNREYHESILRNVLKEIGPTAAETASDDKDELPDL